MTNRQTAIHSVTLPSCLSFPSIFSTCPRVLPTTTIITEGTEVNSNSPTTPSRPPTPRGVAAASATIANSFVSEQLRRRASNDFVRQKTNLNDLRRRQKFYRDVSRGGTDTSSNFIEILQEIRLWQTKTSRAVEPTAAAELRSTFVVGKPTLTTSDLAENFIVTSLWVELTVVQILSKSIKKYDDTSEKRGGSSSRVPPPSFGQL